MGRARSSLLCSVILGLLACLPFRALADQRPADKPFSIFLPMTLQGGANAPASVPPINALPVTPNPVVSPTPVPPTPTAPPVATVPPTATVPVTFTGVITPSDFELEVVRLTNEQRALNGCSTPLNLSLPLTYAARAHSLDTSANYDSNRSPHEGSDGSQPGDRMHAVGYMWQAMGENIEMGAITPQDVVNEWMSAGAYRHNMLNCSFKDIGIGYVEVPDDPNILYTYWTQDFGAQS